MTVDEIAVRLVELTPYVSQLTPEERGALTIRVAGTPAYTVLAAAISEGTRDWTETIKGGLATVHTRAAFIASAPLLREDLRNAYKLRVEEARREFEAEQGRPLHEAYGVTPEKMDEMMADKVQRLTEHGLKVYEASIEPMLTVIADQLVRSTVVRTTEASRDKLLFEPRQPKKQIVEKLVGDFVKQIKLIMDATKPGAPTEWASLTKERRHEILQAALTIFARKRSINPHISLTQSQLVRIIRDICSFTKPLTVGTFNRILKADDIHCEMVK